MENPAFSVIAAGAFVGGGDVFVLGNRDGAVRRGPSLYDQPSYEVRALEGG